MSLTALNATVFATGALLVAPATIRMLRTSHEPSGDMGGHPVTGEGGHMSAAEDTTARRAARSFEVSVTRRIAAPAETVYAVLADYREGHPKILPPSFFVGMTVEEGGRGAGTIVVVQGRFAGRVRAIRGIVTEPEPGRRLVESYPDERIVTAFVVDPEPGSQACSVTISSVFPRRWGPVGWIEHRIVRRLLDRVYAEELDLLTAYVTRAP